MNLQNSYSDYVLNSFPLQSSELSYEIITHKKVYNPDIIMAIPEGKKCFSWFTRYNSENVCFLLELDEKNRIKEVKRIYTGFDDSLALGTIFYGTLFAYKTNNNYINCFCVEDIYHYKNKTCIHMQFNAKLETLRSIFKIEIIQSALNGQFTIFGLPLLSTDFDLLLKCIQKLPYKVAQIKHRFLTKQNARKIITMNYFKPGAKYMNNNNNNNNNNTITQ